MTKRGSARRMARRARRESKSPWKTPALIVITVGAAIALFLLTRPDGADDAKPWPPATGLATTDFTRVGSPSWTPDGNRILFYAQRAGKGKIHIMNADGSGVRLLSGGAGDEGYPVMAPHASTIVFDSDASGQFDIWAMDSSGANARNITNNPARDVAASWSPDGKKIAFMSDRDNERGKFDAYVMNPDGSDPRRITREQTTWFPQFSHDGKRIAFHVGRDVHVANADGGGMRRLTRDPENGMYPSWSPDGKRIVFMSWRSGPTELFTMNADGSAQTKLLGMQEGDVIDPRWSPDGNHIVFVHVRGAMNSAVQSIWIVNADGSGAAQLTKR